MSSSLQQTPITPTSPSLYPKKPSSEQLMYLSKQKLQLENILQKKDCIISILKKQNEQLKSKLAQQIHNHNIAINKLEDYYQKEQRVTNVKISLQRDFDDLKKSINKERESRNQIERKMKVLESREGQMVEKLEQITNKLEEESRKTNKLQQKLEYYKIENEKYLADIQKMKIMLIDRKYKEFQATCCSESQSPPTASKKKYHIASINNKDMRNKMKNRSMIQKIGNNDGNNGNNGNFNRNKNIINRSGIESLVMTSPKNIPITHSINSSHKKPKQQKNSIRKICKKPTK